MPLMIKLNRNVVSVYLCLDNGHFITVYISCSFVSDQDQKNQDIKAVVRNNSRKNFIFLKNKSYYLLDKKVRYFSFLTI